MRRADLKSGVPQGGQQEISTVHTGIQAAIYQQREQRSDEQKDWRRQWRAGRRAGGDLELRGLERCGSWRARGRDEKPAPLDALDDLPELSTTNPDVLERVLRREISSSWDSDPFTGAMSLNLFSLRAPRTLTTSTGVFSVCRWNSTAATASTSTFTSQQTSAGAAQSTSSPFLA